MLMFLLLVAIVLALAYQKAEPITWSGLLALWLISYSLMSPNWLALLLAWALFAALIGLLWLPKQRQLLLIKPVFTWIRDSLPKISETEREAIAAGTVSWDGDLFSGTPEWHKLLALPKPKLSEAEKAFIDGPVERLCEMLNDWEITHQRYDLTPQTWQFIKDQGFFGMIIPTRYGGLEFSTLAHSTVVMKIATRSITAAVTVMVPNSLGPAELLLHYGTAAQQDYYLPRLARGEEIPCFALTSAKAGSDASSITDQGIVCKGQWQGQEVLGLKLTWNKRYITLAPVATLLGLAFKVVDPDQLLGEQLELGITCALIPTSTPGVMTGARHLPLNTVFMNGPTWGENVFIPMDYIIGGQPSIGKGWAMLMDCLAVGRAISLPALATGAGKLSSLTSGAYARIREQFGTPIGYFEGIEEALAAIGGLTYLMDSGRVMTTGLCDQHEKPVVASAILKYHNTEAMRKVVGHAMDIHAGRGVIKGPRNYIARVYQAIPISITVEGANILTRSLIIFGQGSMRSHPFLLKEMTAAQNPDSDQGLRDFDDLFNAHIQRNLQLVARSLVLALTGSRLARETGHCQYSDRYFQHLTRFAAAFALVSDITLMILGGELKRQEKISARLGDCLSYLYLASSVLKRFHDDDCPEADVPLMTWAMQHCLVEIQQALHETLRNYPNKWVGWLLRPLVFPLGRHFQKASDQVEHALAQLLLKPSDCRDRLVAGVYRNERPDDALGRVENAFLKKIAVAEIDQKLKHALRSGALDEAMSLDTQLASAVAQQLLTEQQVKQYNEAAALVADAIAVDHFSPEELPPVQCD